MGDASYVFFLYGERLARFLLPVLQIHVLHHCSTKRCLYYLKQHSKMLTLKESKNGQLFLNQFKSSELSA